jgi:hypothetical protein
LKILIDEDNSAENREEKAFRAWINNIGFFFFLCFIFMFYLLFKPIYIYINLQE